MFQTLPDNAHCWNVFIVFVWLANEVKRGELLCRIWGCYIQGFSRGFNRGGFFCCLITSMFFQTLPLTTGTVRRPTLLASTRSQRKHSPHASALALI